MLGFGFMMWFCSALVIILSISLLRGNYSSMHGKVLDNTADKEGYAKAVGKPTLFMGIGIAIAGILAVVLPGIYSILISFIFLVLVIIVPGIWFVKVQKSFAAQSAK